MAASIPGIEIEALTPRRMYIKRKKSQNLKIKLLAIDKNTETIRVQGEKDREARDYFIRDVLSLHVKDLDSGRRILAIAFRSGMEIELFEAGVKEMPLLQIFHEELLGYLVDFIGTKCTSPMAI